MILTRAYKENWSQFQKLTTRFFCSYFVLYVFSGLTKFIWSSPVSWIAENIFSITYDFSSRGYGSGDTTYQYILILLLFFVALSSTIIWTIIDFNRKSYNQLNYGFLLFLRIVLISYLLIYGIIKLLHMQMIPPTYYQLNQPLGDMSPMRLAWVFMGYSKGFSMFAGGMEIVAAIFLIPRRTQTFGAILSVAVMTQVLIMNLCFDIPVKIFSFHLLLIALIILISDFKRIYQLLILGKSPNKVIIYPKRNKEGRKLIPIVKIVLLIGFVWLYTSSTLSNKNTYMNKLNPYMSGVWQVDSFHIAHTTESYHYQYNERWKKLIISYENSMSVQMLDDSMLHFTTEIDTISKKIVLTHKNIDSDFSYQLENEKYLTLKGTIENNQLTIKLTRKTKKDFLLTSRGFHWINELPLNK